MFRSIRWRLIISYIFLALLVVGAVGSITYQLAENYAETREIQGMRANAQAIALQAEPMMYSPFAAYKLQQLTETSAFLGDLRVRVLDRNQRPITDSGFTEKTEQIMIMVPGKGDELSPSVMFYQVEAGSPFKIPDELVQRLPPGTTITLVERHEGSWSKQFTFKEVIISDKDALDVSIEGPEHHHRSDALVTQIIGDADNPIGYVELSESIDYGSNLLYELKQALVIAGVGAVILAVIFGLWNSYRLSSPIKSLASTSAQMRAGNLSVRANLKTGGEIGELGDQFNQMADSLQSTIQQLEAERDALRRFIADASHELRTPITALKNFNTLLQGPAVSDPSAQAEFLVESQNQIERLTWITANLLDLSRLDAGLLELDLTEYDLREIVVAAIAPFKSLTDKKGISLITQLPDSPVTLPVDCPRMEMAIANLLDNALKFTPEGGEVRVSLKGDSDQIVLVVSDTGEGIPPQDLPHVFERFYRGRGHRVEGSGLGLSIVKSVVEAYGGTVTVESAPDDGTNFTLSWKIA